MFEFDGYKASAMDRGDFNGYYYMSKPEITTVMGPDPKLRKLQKSQNNYTVQLAQMVCKQFFCCVKSSCWTQLLHVVRLRRLQN